MHLYKILFQKKYSNHYMTIVCILLSNSFIFSLNWIEIFIIIMEEEISKMKSKKMEERAWHMKNS